MTRYPGRTVDDSIDAKAINDMRKLRQYDRCYTRAVDNPIDHPLISSVQQQRQSVERIDNDILINRIQKTVFQRKANVTPQPIRLTHSEANPATSQYQGDG